MAVPKLTELLRRRADTRAGDVAYEFVDDEGAFETLTYGELAARAYALASRLLEQEAGPTLLLYPPGLDYVAAVYACFAAGVPAVPAYPPEPWRPEAGLARLRRLLDDARPAAVLSHPWFAQVLEAAGAPDLQERVISVEDWSAVRTEEEPRPRERSEVALVQYTSGSTGAPKGVVVRHSSLEHNIGAITQAFRLTPASRGFIWLPPYHDMGLIGGILTPMELGFPVRLMSPLDFLKRPLSWLRQISETGATVSGGPSFAYDLCVRRRADEDELAELDLSTWEVAFNGAEPIRPRTLVAFAEKFRPAGFRASAFFPCYGLAEATLIVTGKHWDGDDAMPVSCGPAVAGQKLAIVDPAEPRHAGAGEEGEIWISGPSVTNGYWSGNDGDLFGTLDGQAYLRTGDLGYVRDDELYVTGRTKDVIVYRGANYHASDVEDAAVAGVGGLRPVAAAFGVDEPEPFAAIVVEARPTAGDPHDVAAAVRTRTLETTGLRLDAVVVAPPGTLPKTTSGKVQRRLCRERFLAGAYDDFLAFRDGSAASSPAGADAPGLLVDVCRGVFAAACSADDCAADQTLYELGGDSVRAAEVAGALEAALGVHVPVAVVLEAATPAATAAALLELWRAEGHDDTELDERLTGLVEEAEAAEVA